MGMRQFLARCYRAYPTEKQQSYIHRMFGCQRKVWNELLCAKIEHHKKFCRTLRNHPSDLERSFPYLNEVDQVPLANTLLELEKAWDHCMKSGKYPDFIPKNKEKKSYVLLSSRNDLSVVFRSKRNNHVSFGNLGWLKFTCHRPFPTGGRLLHARLSNRFAGCYHISFCFEIDAEVKTRPVETDLVEGLDYSQMKLAVSSSGMFDPGSEEIHWYRNLEDRLAHEQKKLSRMELFSKNWWKQKNRLAKIHSKAVCRRNDFLHKYSHCLAVSRSAVAVEDIDMRVMARKKHMGKNAMDNGWGKLRRFLSYKLESRGKKLVVIPWYFPSSKLCGFCGYVNNSITLDDRTITCPSCHHVYDRDLNAAENIKREGIRLLRTGGPPGIARWKIPSGS